MKRFGMEEEDFLKLKKGDKVKCIGVEHYFQHLTPLIGETATIDSLESYDDGISTLSARIYFQWENLPIIQKIKWNDGSFRKLIKKGRPIPICDKRISIKKVAEKEISRDGFNTNPDNWKNGLGLL